MNARNQSLYDAFAQSARRFPDQPALEVAGESISYARLSRAADGTAEAITEARGRVRGVGLLTTRSAAAYAAYLGILRLGARVVPLNLDFPVARNLAICELADVDIIIADTGGQEWLSRMHARSALARRALFLSDAAVLAADPTRNLPPHEPDPDSDAYLLFTSGSTGKPKGVPIKNRNVQPFLAYNVQRYEIAPGCRMSHTFDLTYDLSVYDLFLTWSGGATLVVPTKAELLALTDYLVGRRISHLCSVPSAISVGAEIGSLRPGVAPDLRYSVFGGEQFTYQQAIAWHAAAPGSVIDNLYGPTELTVGCSSFRLPADPQHWPRTSNDTVPIGEPYPSFDCLITEEGELCLRGPQRFDGYLDPRHDAGRFLEHDGSTSLTPGHYYRTGDRVRREAGSLVHLGRLDNQVKVRGYRVELGELEAVLRRHPAVSQSIVTALGDGAERELIVCYTGESVPHTDLRRTLSSVLPAHLVPRRFRHLETMPLNANGKIDRAAIAKFALEA
jgi:amino acid adenylation domain-containing protein